MGASWPWSLDLQQTCAISAYHLPLTLWIRTPLRWSVLDTTLCDKVCQWRAAVRWFSPGTPISFKKKKSLSQRYNWNFFESGVKHHKPNHPNVEEISSSPEYSWKIARWTLNTNQSINQSINQIRVHMSRRVGKCISHFIVIYTYSNYWFAWHYIRFLSNSV